MSKYIQQCVFFYLMFLIDFLLQLKKQINMETKVKHLLLTKSENLTFSKLRFSRKENLKKCTNFEEQKGTRYIWLNVYIGIIVFNCLSSTKQCLRFLLNCFIGKIKGFYQSSFGNEVDFRDIMNISLNILAKN